MLHASALGKMGSSAECLWNPLRSHRRRARRRAGRVRYRSTEKSHVLRIRIDSEVTKQDIKVRLVKPGLLEIEWPRSQGEEIPVE